ncbi:DUF1223 domain-containing protein [Sulfitobacter donghicola]|uniref:Uncharacterized protein n=1 Tax=Sulfitobacter donghicola DSW-25 = KCTC 12864 = JCM 14565 TaxID=1300350 RepID=A0A073IKM4_9RHOB|nr:DUF1223 domain-containing protein [Sulfitobacter donghicola]KEJ90115.1 hypothetical protein DSW25_07900 [Sulfitobacter donghicola DSW-25 = KCTC 12864 = JCM 14565]KIN66732.1 DUF1223 domain containing protein [Sulfitobacter donghicola DSW-25 = KCTC 12864 = JCM 14565]
MSKITNILTGVALSLSTSIVAPAFADQHPVVVELYTSQGCSSCPPADAMLAELSGRDDVIAIALHVDYWDYIGWKDEFGDAGHAKRQRDYANKAGRRTIYTPEMIVQGQTDIVGAKPKALSKAIAEHKAKAPLMELKAVRDGATVKVEGSVPTTGAAPMEVHVLQVLPSHKTRITRGENRGNTLQYSNIAHDWQLAGQWDGADALTMTLDVRNDDPVVVLVQEANAGAIIGAVRVD